MPSRAGLFTAGTTKCGKLIIKQALLNSINKASFLTGSRNSTGRIASSLRNGRTRNCLTLFDLQLDAQFLIYLHIIHLLKSSTCFEHYLAHLQLGRGPPEDEQGNARNM